MIYLSIIVPVLNEEPFIEATLEMLMAQDYPKDRFEILIADGMSTDKTRFLVEDFIRIHPDNNIRLLLNHRQLSSCARNIGVRESQGEFIGVIDGHVFLPNGNLFKNMERLAKENKALCLARPAPLDVPGLEEGKAYWIAVARKTWLGHSKKSYIYSDFEGFVGPVSSGFAYHKSVFEKVGYFDESFDAAEDVEFHFRLKEAGIMGYTSPRLLIYSFPRESFWDLFKQHTRYGAGRARFVRKHPGGFTIETLIPLVIFLFFIMAPVTLLFFRNSSLIALLHFTLLSLYGMILLIGSFIEVLKRNKFFYFPLVAFGIWTTHMGLGWGFLKTIIKPNLK